jgi:Uncharacterized integral membrane protein
MTESSNEQKQNGNDSQKALRVLGCVCLCIVLSPAIFVFCSTAFIMLNWAYRDIPKYGEHLAEAKEYSPEATNYFYYNVLLHQVCEFDIPEDAFLEMCKAKEYATPVRIETLADLPPPDDKEYPRINDDRKVPVIIRRYIWHESQHEKCIPSSGACEVDPTGETDASCYRTVPQGYYSEIRASDGGGIKVVFDSENGRCYIHSSPH